MSVSHLANSLLESRLLARLNDKNADPFAFLTDLTLSQDSLQSSGILVMSNLTSKASSEPSPKQQLAGCMASLNRLAPGHRQLIKRFTDKLLERSEITLDHIQDLEILVNVASHPQAQTCLSLYVDGTIAALSDDETLSSNAKIQNNFLKAQNRLIDAMVNLRSSEELSNLGPRILTFLNWLHSLEPFCRKEIKHFMALLTPEKIVEHFSELEALMPVAQLSKKMSEYLDDSKISEEIEKDQLNNRIKEEARQRKIEKTYREEFVARYVSGKIAQLMPLPENISVEKQAEHAFLKAQCEFMDVLRKCSFYEANFEAACSVLARVRKDLYYREKGVDVFHGTSQRCNDLTAHLKQVTELMANDNPTVGEVNRCIDSANVVSRSGQKLDKAFILIGSFISAASAFSGLWLGIPFGIMMIGAATLSHKAATQQRENNKEEISCLAERPFTDKPEKSTVSNKVFNEEEKISVQEKTEVQEQCPEQSEPLHAEKHEDQKEPLDEKSENIIILDVPKIENTHPEIKNKLSEEMERLSNLKETSELGERISTFLQWLPSLSFFYQEEINRLMAHLTVEKIVEHFHYLEELMEVAKISKRVTEEGGYKLTAFYMSGIIAELEPLSEDISFDEQAAQAFYKAQRQFISAMVTLSKRDPFDEKSEEKLMLAYSILSEVRSCRYAQTTEVNSDGKREQVNLLICGTKESEKLTSHLNLVADFFVKPHPTVDDIGRCVNSANSISSYNRIIPAVVITASILLMLVSIPTAVTGVGIVVGASLLFFAALSLKGITKIHDVNKEKIESLAERSIVQKVVHPAPKQDDKNKENIEVVVESPTNVNSSVNTSALFSLKSTEPFESNSESVELALVPAVSAAA